MIFVVNEDGVFEGWGPGYPHEHDFEEERACCGFGHPRSDGAIVEAGLSRISVPVPGAPDTGTTVEYRASIALARGAGGVVGLPVDRFWLPWGGYSNMPGYAYANWPDYDF